jgi:PAS domain S-box-containing protein
MKKPLQVLQVEDSESDADMVLRLLRQAGYDVHDERVENADEMKAALDKQAWEVIIADFALPRFNGPSALALLQQTGLDIPFIVVSGTVGEEVAVAMMKAGAHDYLMKDRLLRLVPAIEREIREAQIRRERRQAQAELQASEQRFRALIEHSADVISTLTAEGVILYQSPAILSVLGYQPNEVFGRNAFEFLHPDEYTANSSLFHQLLQRPDITFTSEFRFKHKDGTWRWLGATGVNLLAEPHVQAIVINYRDITARRQMEEALRISEQKFSRAFRASPEALVLSRQKDGAVLDMNESWERISGYSRAEVIGQSSLVLDLFESPAQRQQVMTQLQAQGFVRDFEIKLRRKSGEVRQASLSMEPIELDNEACLLTIVHDITERKQAETQLMAQLSELRRWHRATLGREMRILDLKREVNELLAQAGQPPRYVSAEDTSEENIADSAS